jgi:hypothetical protein
MRFLFKTTIHVWSEFDPSNVGISRLCLDAEEGCSYCSSMVVVCVEEPEKDPDWVDTEFFDQPE